MAALLIQKCAQCLRPPEVVSVTSYNPVTFRIPACVYQVANQYTSQYYWVIQEIPHIPSEARNRIFLGKFWKYTLLLYFLKHVFKNKYTHLK